ncbi:PAS domain-containing hybrid sensor histidine kinase/response regulator [Cryobacterium roopkundense]|uniref:histidine kinase n=1 Tax=Cryobacterium roopkundense TaxID=1001240 RepID=A0A7W9E423_9MICO|nr:PAS domain-containing hybrid sensor histidine kinase/response regulator [Cryobacterium roopkundense]MBB5641661.1 PAS domain S-box-containing protein [Cryobacterium roopkundense]
MNIKSATTGTESEITSPTRGTSDSGDDVRRGALQNAIFNSANFSSIATDADGVIQIFNVGAERMLGYTADEVVNKITPADISDPQELIMRAEELSTELDTPITKGFEALVFKASRGIEDIYELTYVRKDGTRFPAMVSVTALRDAADTIIGYLLIGTDNTARKLAEEELLQAGALQSAIFNSANFSSIATDARGVIQIFNVGAERMLGYSALDVVNRITPADISDPQELIMRASELSLELDTPITPGFEALVFKASRGIEDIYELTYVRQDGSRFPAIVSVTALRDPEGKIIGYLLIGTDNTARKQVEATQALLDQRLRDQQFYTRSLIESNVDALMALDPQGIISDVNQQMVSLTGRTRDELIGAPCRNFFTDPVRADAAIRRVLAENKVSDYELTVRALNGEETVVSYNAATFHDRDRKLQGIIAAARDITERRRFERALQGQNVELEHASRMKSEFLATMSHELRTPLNAIIGFSEALKDGLMGEMTDTQNEYIGDIFTSGQHLLSLINDILDLSKVEAGMMHLELEPVDLKSLLMNSLSIVREKAAAHRIQLEIEAGDELGVPNLDPRKTKQIVYNLLSNAVKFSSPGARVTLRARRVSRTVVGTLSGGWPVHSFPLAKSDFNHFLEISVEDTGIGISEVNMGKLFQAFSQIDSGLARKFEGTGLGLAMVKQLAELYGGTVAVSSAEGEGARFAVWVPLHESGTRLGTPPAPKVIVPTPTSGPASYPVGSVRPTALVVEDDEQSADLVRLLLEAEGFRVIVASSGEEAVLLAPQQSLSMITLDIGLPGMDGWTCLKRLRDDKSAASVPVVIIAGLADSRLALTRGVAAVLEKPLSRSELKNTLSILGLQPEEKLTRTVLIVDDDPRAVELITTYLPASEYAVVRAYGGGEGITLAQRVRPDLILLDLMMPDLGGLDVVRTLRRNSATSSIPILVITARQLSDEERVALTGAHDQDIRVIDKAGFSRATFMAEVKSALH